MKHRFEKRILSLVLCLSMVFTLIITHANFAFSAENEEDIPQINTENFENNVGKQAIFDWWSSFELAPDVEFEPGDSVTYYYDELEIAERVFVIADYYSDNDGNHWYKLYASDGMEAPEILKENPWVLYSNDEEVKWGFDPYLCIYEAEDTIRFITAEETIYELDEDGNIFLDDNGNPVIDRIDLNYFVIAGPEGLNSVEISITPCESDYPVSVLAYKETTYNTVFSSALTITIDKAAGEEVDLWSDNDGIVSIRYEAAQLGTDTYVEDVAMGAGFLYVDGKLYSAASTDRWGYEQSDVVYTNAGESTLVFEHMPSSCIYVGEEAYFVNDSVTLYDNNMQAAEFLAAQLPVTFTAECSFIYDDVEYYWLENKGFIGSPYFIVKAEDVELGELPKEYGDGRVSITDKMGNSVSKIVLPKYEKPEFTAISSLSQSTADVKYQWQIEYEDGKWVDIYGEDNATIKISYGMVASLLDDNLSVNFRCVTTAGTKTAYSAPVPVTLEMYEPKEPDVVVSESFVTSNGETVTVSVAGDIPEDASVALEETDTEGITVDEGEVFVAALDISIKNADGTEWQPESGESVTVNLPASSIGLMEGDDFVVYHLHNGEVRILGTYTVTDGTVSFEVDGFSKFVFALASNAINFDYSADIGKHAHLTWSDEVMFEVLDFEPDANFTTLTFSYDVADFSTDFVIKITDYKVVTQLATTTIQLAEDSVGDPSDTVETRRIYSLWYQFDIVKGDCPEELFNGMWVLQNYLSEEDAFAVDTLTLFDAPDEPIVPDEPEEPVEPSVGITVNGETVDEVTVSKSDKVTVTATPNVEGSMTYKWQILIPAMNMWVNISGQTSANCTINYGMVANSLDSNGQAHIRCVTTVNGVEVISEPIAVNLATTYSLFNNYWMPVSKTLSSPNSRAGEGDTTKYTVTVYYYIGDTAVMQREVYTMEFGVNEEPRTTSFPVPLKEGYTAYFFDENASTGIENGTIHTEVEHVLENYHPGENKNYYVRYYPNDDTKYVVEHYKQNAEDDEYTLFNTEEFEGTSDSLIPEFDSEDTLAYDLEGDGFYAVPYQIVTIAADGSTIVKIYYDRYMYLLMFNLGEGGMGVDPIYARVGVEYVVNEEPIRRGYTFEGWELPDGTKIDKNAKPYVFVVPASNTTVTALWKTGETKYTVVYWKENADPDKDANGEIVRDAEGNPVYSYSYWTHVEMDAKTGDEIDGTNNIVTATSVTQTEANYFTFNSVATDKDVIVKGNGSTVVNVYYLRNYYEIYFYADGNTNELTSCAVTPHNHNDGTCEKYLICAKEGHVHDDTCIRLGLSCGVTVHTHTEECCTLEEHSSHTSACCTKDINHTHSPNCYEGNGIIVSDTAETPNKAPTRNLTEGYVYKTGSTRYVYVNSKWYRVYNSNYADKSTATLYCSGAHNHNDGTCTCSNPIHTHDDGNCKYNHYEHKAHTDACYDWNCGITDSHKHTNACYSACTKPVHTHGSDCTDDDQYLLKIIRAKYDADISAEWPVANDDKTNIPGLTGFGYWTGNGNNQSSRVVTMNSDWAKGSGSTAVKVNANYRSNAYQLNYWFEDWDQTDRAETSDRKKYNGTWYKLSNKYTQVAYYGSTDSWSYKKITGMIAAGSSATISNGIANLYYKREDYTLKFDNDGEFIYTENNVMFEKPLDYYLDDNGNYITTIIPTKNPIDKPANGYYFEGWYTTRECFEGTKVDFNTLTMPNNDLTLFANWAPKTHTVEFFFDGSLTQRLDEEKFPTQKILHNEYGANPGIPGHPLDFEAITWFYKDANGVEKTFTFDMAVTEDMKLYPKWRTDVYINYEVRFKVYDRINKVYTDIEIASPIYGKELYGEGVTLNPKGTDEFYPEYQTVGNGYFPLSGSHTIVMGEANCPTGNVHCVWDEATSTHIYTFYYLNGPTVPYTVQYHEVDSNGNFIKKLQADKYVADNYYAKVVENAAFINGYMPDEAQKTLYVEVDADGFGNNVITFNYTKDDDASFYRVSHWVKKYGSTEYVLVQKDDFACHVGDIISSYPPLELPGVTYTHTEIKPANNIVGTSENDQPGLTVDIYYEEESVTINYVVKGPEGCGTLSLYTETIGAYYGTVTGSAASTNGNQAFKFVGWYSDEACNIEVSYNEANNKLTPSKVNATYYAKFEYNLTSLTIKKEGWEAIDPNQTFIFNVLGNNVNLDVTVHGNGSVTIDGLTVGETYVITEKIDWSWRYASEGWVHGEDKGTENVASITIGLNDTITFTNSRPEDQWLDGDSWCNNMFNTPDNQTK